MSNIAAQNLNFGHMQCLVRLHGGNNNRGHSSYGCTSQGKITPPDAQAAVFLFGSMQLQSRQWVLRFCSSRIDDDFSVVYVLSSPLHCQTAVKLYFNLHNPSTPTISSSASSASIQVGLLFSPLCAIFPSQGSPKPYRDVRSAENNRTARCRRLLIADIRFLSP